MIIVQVGVQSEVMHQSAVLYSDPSYAHMQAAEIPMEQGKVIAQSTASGNQSPIQLQSLRCQCRLPHSYPVYFYRILECRHSGRRCRVHRAAACCYRHGDHPHQINIELWQDDEHLSGGRARDGVGQQHSQYYCQPSRVGECERLHNPSDCYTPQQDLYLNIAFQDGLVDQAKSTAASEIDSEEEMMSSDDEADDVTTKEGLEWDNSTLSY